MPHGKNRNNQEDITQTKKNKTQSPKQHHVMTSRDISFIHTSYYQHPFCTSQAPAAAGADSPFVPAAAAALALFGLSMRPSEAFEAGAGGGTGLFSSSSSS
jgi:hypothetical protein